MAKVTKLNTEIGVVHLQPEAQKTFSSQGVAADTKTPEALGKHVVAGMAR